MGDLINFSIKEVFDDNFAERLKGIFDKGVLFPLISPMRFDSIKIDWHKLEILQKSFLLDSPSDEDRIMIGEDYTGLSLFDKSIGKIKNDLGSIIRRKFNPTPEDLDYNQKVDKMACIISADMGEQVSMNVDQADAFAEEVIKEHGASPSLLDNINSTITNIKNKLNRKVQDRRVFNGRKAEDHLCETFTDSQIIDLMKRTHEHLFGKELCVSPLLNRFLVCFQDALFKWIKENKNFDYIKGKTAHYCRMVVETVGEYIGSGVRNIQKHICWFYNKLGFLEPITPWQSREKEKKREWERCSSDIYNYLCIELPLIAEPD